MSEYVKNAKFDNGELTYLNVVTTHEIYFSTMTFKFCKHAVEQQTSK